MNLNEELAAKDSLITTQSARIAELEAQIAAASAPVVEQKPIARVTTRDKPSDLFDIIILDRARCKDGMALYADPQAADTDKLREAIKYSYELRVAIENAAAGYGEFIDPGLAETIGKEIITYLAASTALQAPVREVLGWQPIETAPKDGTCILVCRAWDADGKPMGNSHRLFTHRAAWWSDENGGNGEWIVYNSMVKDPECFFTPTHWMPVPDIEVPPLPADPVQEPKP